MTDVVFWLLLTAKEEEYRYVLLLRGMFFKRSD